MSRARRHLLTAAVPGTLSMILLFLALDRCGIPSGFWIALGVGAGAFLLTFLTLFFMGLRTAAAFDRWEKTRPAPLFRTDASLFAPGEKPGEGKLYLFPEKLVFVRFRRGEAKEFAVAREEIREAPEEGEDLLLLLRDGRAISFVLPGKKEALAAISEAFAKQETHEA